MNKKDLLKLILHKEVFYNVAYLLLAMGIIETPKEDPSISRLVLTDKGHELLGSKATSVDLEFIKKYRELFPPHRKGELSAVGQNLAWLMNTYEYSEQQILEAANSYLRTIDDPKYCQQADYFIYKNLPNGTVRNSILSFFEEQKEIEEGYGWEVV